MMGTMGMGWLPDYPDFRDYTMEQSEVGSKLKMLGQKDSVKAMLKKVGVGEPKKTSLSPRWRKRTCSRDMGAESHAGENCVFRTMRSITKK